MVDTEIRQTDEPVLDAAHLADNVVVLEVLEEASPWYDRRPGSTRSSSRTAGPKLAVV
ncbi:hypothetical protein [Nocardia sp. NPDC059228]|uniref:hypothetical protein n=1 Tax=Nocardia sp. NPDC059228 TaxID=3346777 RepID=UPI00368098CC